ncbi:hypothetical protein, partial [Vibrio mimicus]|uniref:hypothetical protein n=1 Tax=Vibrio mimicus TaxID=674 RepID=UPI001CA36F44
TYLRNPVLRLGFLLLGRKSTITTDTRTPRRAFSSTFSAFLSSLSFLYSRIPASILLNLIPFLDIKKFNCLVVACVQRNTFSAVYLESSRFGGKGEDNKKPMRWASACKDVSNKKVLATQSGFG